MAVIHADIRIKGIVQGVGFRPFIHRTVRACGLSGTVRNTSYGALVCLEGEESAVAQAVTALRQDAPPIALIEAVEAEMSEKLEGFTDFEILPSERGSERRTLISPDVATCDDCLRELFDPKDRRWRYPFINCTNCGPRFTITRDIPYDRKNTTMAAFPMCDACRNEYEDIENRRYHAQPDCCGDCGPRLAFYDARGIELSGDAAEHAVQYLKDGKIVAVKGLGGVHLACRCDDVQEVRRLRERKRRDEKPFAIMCRDVSAARQYAEISAQEEGFLTCRQRPIVLLKKRAGAQLSHISENGYVGIMLPYTPVHHLLLEGGESLVMTSANLSDLPIVYKDGEAMECLRGIADGFLMHDREIHTRCDDSLMWVYRGGEYFARRSRGYVPHPIDVEGRLFRILACGAEQKASFAISRESHVFPSQHIGDLKNLETLESYEAQIAHFENIFDISPEVLACDMHPDYMSTAYAAERGAREGLRVIRVQHHHAHMASCMADNRYDRECIGIIWDGTGCGTDGTIWGSEFLVGDFSGFTRRGTIRPIRLPGGDRAAREIWRIRDSLLADAGLPCESQSVKVLLESGINCPKTCGMGRLFDGVCALLGIKEHASYEGQGAILLEAAAQEGVLRTYPFAAEAEDGLYALDWRDMIREIARERARGVPVGECAAAFMNTLVEFAARTAARLSQETGKKTVAISGGTFQNMYMLTRLVPKLEGMGMTVLTHRRVSPNDEGISLGQLMIAQKMMEGDMA